MRKPYCSPIQTPDLTPLALGCEAQHEAGLLGGTKEEDSGDNNEDGCSGYYSQHPQEDTQEVAAVTPPTNASRRRRVVGVAVLSVVVLMALLAAAAVALARGTTGQSGLWEHKAAPGGIVHRKTNYLRLGVRRMSLAASEEGSSTLSSSSSLDLQEGGEGAKQQGLAPPVDESRADVTGVAEATGSSGWSSGRQPQQQQGAGGYNPTSPETVGVPLAPPKPPGPSSQAPDGSTSISPMPGGSLTNQMGTMTLTRDAEGQGN